MDGYAKIISANAFAIVDLHLHLDGSLSVKAAKRLAQLQGITIPQKDEEIAALLQVRDGCQDLNEYLEKFAFPCSLLQTKAGIEMAVALLEQELKEQGLLYAEIRFAPQKHMEQGLTQSEVVAAAIKGMQKTDFCANLILCCMRGKDNHAENMETIRVAREYLGKGVCAADLAGAEALFPTADFAEVFALARELEVPFTIHAGEAAGAESIYQAVAFGAKRIGHGVHAAEDPALLQLLAEKQIALELCPTSNLNTNIFESLSVYPLKRFLDAGIAVTLNTDNMAVSNTTLQAEYQKMMEASSLSKEEWYRVALHTITSSFADEEIKAGLKQALDQRIQG